MGWHCPRVCLQEVAKKKKTYATALSAGHIWSEQVFETTAFWRCLYSIAIFANEKGYGTVTYLVSKNNNSQNYSGLLSISSCSSEISDYSKDGAHSGNHGQLYGRALEKGASDGAWILCFGQTVSQSWSIFEMRPHKTLPEEDTKSESFILTMAPTSWKQSESWSALLSSGI